MDDRYRQYLMEGQAAGSRYALVGLRQNPRGVAGSRLGRGVGSSLEFMDYRGYQPGDDLRRIDWSAYARSDKLIVKQFREEVTPHLDILVDGSASMDLEETDKARATLALAALLAQAATASAFTCHVYLSGDRIERLPGDSGPPATWEGVALESTRTLADAFATDPPRLGRRSVRVLISDLLWLGDPLALLTPLAAEASSLVVVQLLARADTETPEVGNYRVVDCETGQAQEVYVDTAGRKRYRDALSRHQQNWSRAARQLAAVMTTVVAEDFLEDWQLDDLVAADILKVT